MQISNEDLKILKYLYKHPASKLETLEKRFKGSARTRIYSLKSTYSCIAISSLHNPDNPTNEIAGLLGFSLNKKGENLLIDHISEQHSKSKERWLDRLWGCVFGALTSLTIAWLLHKMNIK